MMNTIFVKKIFFVLGLFLFAFYGNAQHDTHYSSFMFNKLAINPAYAGSQKAASITAVYRSQWSGLKGAPTTISVSGHTPMFNQRAGIGLGLVRDKIGILNTTKLDLSYAYRMPLTKKMILALAINGQLENVSRDWTKSAVVDAGDDLVPLEEESSLRPNFGAGAYLQSSNFYVGLSMPAFFKNGLYSKDSQRNFRSMYLMAGWVTDISRNVKFKPAALLSFNPKAPITIDFNANFLFMKILWVGASYRLGDSIDGIIQYQVNPQIRTGIAVDFTLTELQNHSKGSYELMVEYTFKNRKVPVENLRYF